MGVFGSGPQDRGMLDRQAHPSCSFVPGGSRVEWGPAWGAVRQDRTGGGKNGGCGRADQEFCGRVSSRGKTRSPSAGGRCVSQVEVWGWASPPQTELQACGGRGKRAALDTCKCQ